LCKRFKGIPIDTGRPEIKVFKKIALIQVLISKNF
jgi:hypothetical protein